MRGLNKAMIIGTLGQDPEVRYTSNGGAVANLSVATNEEWKDKQTGEKKESTEWHRVVIFGKLAEIAGEYLRKGSQVYLEGKIQTRKWQDQSGSDRYSTEINANQMQMLGGRDAAQATARDKPQSGADKTQSESTPMASGGGFDDIPFNQIDWRTV